MRPPDFSESDPGRAVNTDRDNLRGHIARHKKATIAAGLALISVGYEALALVNPEAATGIACRVVFADKAMERFTNPDETEDKCLSYEPDFNECNLTVEGGGRPFSQDCDCGVKAPDRYLGPLAPLAPVVFPIRRVMKDGLFDAQWRDRKGDRDNHREGGLIFCDTATEFTGPFRPPAIPPHQRPTFDSANLKRAYP